jgi:asparagine synthase (glutamine-hydrolysing)
MTREIGGFAGMIVHSDRVYAFRDVNGLKPLYYARSPRLTGFASERKALWRIGLKDPNRVPPGSMISLHRKRMTVTPVVHFRHSRKKQMTFSHASGTLQRYLSAAIRRVTSGTGKVCVAFSGGLDSAVTAAIANREGVELQAVSVGLVGGSEVSTVEKFATQLGLHVTLETFPADSIEEYVRRVLWLIEEPNLMKLSVAIPLHWAAMVAAQRGYRVMLCGQGSDELYGGYSKYATTLRLGGRNALAAHLYRSVVESSQVNYERDDQATSPFPVELRTPFADPDLIRFSLTIPSEFKVKDGNDVTRKWVLRDVARRIGVPDEIVWRRKKAIQHGTGVEKAILKLAKSRGLRPDDYLSKTFEEVSRLESMPLT